ncbi:MAG: ATP-binding protein, partial [Candidatus Eremiobacteraeota bacterium]|nr:ATP-binding protein [Candidatus Eremiobacteraeota bacterium]
WGRAASVLKENEDVLSQRVSDRCFAELDSYRNQHMPREESFGTVKRLLEHIVRKLHAIEEGDVSADAQALHDELVHLEEGIAARRVRMAIEFEDLIKGLHIMRQEVWNGLARVFDDATAGQIFGLERRINDVFDEFFIGLASSYLKTQKELVRRHESSLAKWEEVVKSASQIRLKIPCREEFAATVRLQAEAIARRVWFTEEEIYDIITAVGEVCDNAIEHGTSEMGIDVQYFMTPTEFRVEVQDYGSGFDPSGRGEEPPDLFSERGRGIFLMKHLMDRLEIDSESGQGTRVIIAKSRQTVSE